MQLPDPAFVVLVGASGSGKSIWAAGRYGEVEVVSSDAVRAVVSSKIPQVGRGWEPIPEPWVTLAAALARR